MITFYSGPAEGKVLMLKAAPRFLRVTEINGEWDALDQLNDTPRPGETLHAYARRGDAWTAHINRGAKGSGFFAGAIYDFIHLQPSQEVMRDYNLWLAWCGEHRHL